MKQVHQMLLRLRDTRSLKDKAAILGDYVGDDEVEMYLRATLEPTICFYQKEIDKTEASLLQIGNPTINFDRNLIRQIQKDFSGRVYTGDTARSMLNSIYNSLESFWERELLSLMIEKDIKAGTGVGTINKIFPGLITQVPYMRCCLPKDTKLDSADVFDWKKGVYSQVKSDGMYGNLSLRAEGGLTVQTRNGNVLPPFMSDALLRDFKAFANPDNIYQGELLVQRKGVVLPREVGNGIFNSILHGGEDNLEEFDEIVFHCWDVIPKAHFTAKTKYEKPYEERFKALQEEVVGKFLEVVNLSLGKVVYSLEEAYKHNVEVLALGLEGTIIKDSRAPWVDGTSKQQVKLKVEFEVDLEITGFKEGEGKYAATFGSIEVKSLDRDLVTTVSGISDALRLSINQNRDYYIGKIMTVRANDITETDGVYSLFLPRHIEIREDKDTADTLEQVRDALVAAKSNPR